jgi:hypothetical protein
MEDYYKTKRQKQSDFFTGFFTNMLVALIAGVICGIFWGLISLIEAKTVTYVLDGIAIALVVAALAIYEIRTIKKHLKERRYIAIGMISALILPLLVVGTCSPFIFMGSGA